MKVMHTTTTTLNTKEFNKLSDKIIDSLYELNPEIQELYDIHINFIDEGWQVAFIPLSDDIPVIKVNTYTEYDDSNNELLKISPESIAELPEKLKLKGEDKSYDLCMHYVSIFEFIISLYDYEYRL